MAQARSGVMITAIMDTEAVKIEKITLKPGARTGFHGDGVPYTMIACTSGRTVRFNKEGKFLELLYLEPGLHIQRSASFAHDVMNVSDHDVVMLKVYRQAQGGRGRVRGASR